MNYFIYLLQPKLNMSDLLKIEIFLRTTDEELFKKIRLLLNNFLNNCKQESSMKEAIGNIELIMGRRPACSQIDVDIKQSLVRKK